MRLRPKSADAEENIFWMTMTDLMTGLVLVFMVLFFCAYMQGNMNKIQEQVAQESVSKELQKTLKEQNIDAVVESSGVVKIQDLELFEVSKYNLSDKGKEYLDKFAPVYLNSIFSNKFLSENIEKIIIQGHTDSQTFVGEFSEDEQYMKNMELSLNRAFAVANYMSNTPYNKENGDRLRKMIVVEGASFSEPVIVDGKEDFAKSRRVELKLVMKNKAKKEALETSGVEQQDEVSVENSAKEEVEQEKEVIQPSQESVVQDELSNMTNEEVVAEN